MKTTVIVAVMFLSLATYATTAPRKKHRTIARNQLAVQP